MLKHWGFLRPAHLYQICCAPELKNTREAVALCRGMRYRVSLYATWLQKNHFPTLDADNYCDHYLNKLVDYSDFPTIRVKATLRAAFRKLKFRCLLKAFAPGHAEFKRMREEFEDDFQA